MVNIKIGETLIENVSLTDSGDLLGIKFVTEMALNSIANLFDANTSPEVRVIENEQVTKIYKNRNIVSLSMSNGDDNRTVDVVLVVTPTELKEVEMLTTQVGEQATTIAAQSEQIAEQETEINNLKNALTEAEAKITESESMLAETQEINSMLMECVLEMSEVVYA